MSCTLVYLCANGGIGMIKTCKENVRYCCKCEEFKTFESEPTFTCPDCGQILAIKVIFKNEG